MDLSRVVRDDFIAHLCAGGTAEAAAAELCAAYRPARVGAQAAAEALLTLALTAWETGRLTVFLKREAIALLARLDPPQGVAVADWAVRMGRIAARLEAPQPERVDLRAAAARLPWAEGTVVQSAPEAGGADGFFLVLDKHWIHGAFHALAAALTYDGTCLRLLDSAPPPPVFVLRPGDPRLCVRADLRTSYRQRRAARRQIRHIHARLVAPQDMQAVLANLRARSE